MEFRSKICKMGERKMINVPQCVFDFVNVGDIVFVEVLHKKDLRRNEK